MGGQLVHAHLRRLPPARGPRRRPDRPQARLPRGLVVFTVASFLNGIADSSTFLILARGLQGLGAALIAPAALSIITTTFAEGPTVRGARRLGWIATGGAAVGLLLGGILVEFLSWPWIFFLNVPVGIATFLASLKYVPESRADAEHRSSTSPGAVTVPPA